MRRPILLVLLFTTLLLSATGCKKKEDGYSGIGDFEISWKGWQLARIPISFSSNVDSAYHTFQWYFGDGSTSTLAAPKHEYYDNKTYIVRLVLDGDTANAVSKSIEIGTFVMFYIDGGRTPGDTMFFTLSTPLPATTSFYWDFGDGSTSTEAEPRHIYTAPGTDTVRLILDDETAGVHLQIDRPITILPDPLYTKDMLGPHLWHISVHDITKDVGYFRDTSYTYDETFAINMMDKLRVYASGNTVPGLDTRMLFYHTGLSSPGKLVFGDGGLYPYITLTYDHAADTMHVACFLSAVGNHNNPGYSHKAWIDARTP